MGSRCQIIFAFEKKTKIHDVSSLRRDLMNIKGGKDVWEFPQRGQDRSRQCLTKTEISLLSFEINSISFAFVGKRQK